MFKYDWFSGTGKGGQHRNKHQNCCRCIHEETGIVANGTRNRSREANKRDALAVCKARVYAHFHKDKDRYLAGHERVRTYHEPDNRVIDHASGERFVYTDILNKSIGPAIEARRLAMSELAL